MNNTQMLYKGLTWSDFRGTGRQAPSDTTGGRYTLEPKSEGLWDVKFGWPDRPGRPHVLVGTYNDPETSRVAAERHDFVYWSSTIKRTGSQPVFIGSGDESDLFHKLGENGDEISELLIEAAERQNGKIFSQTASFFPAKKNGLKQERNGTFSLTLSFEGKDLPRWMMESDMGTDILFGALELGGPQEDDWEERSQRALRRCFSLPTDNSFQNWMLHRYDKWKLIAGAVQSGTSDEVEKATSETLKRLLSCPSRKDLLRNRDAIEKLEKLDQEFYLDLSRGFGAV